MAAEETSSEESYESIREQFGHPFYIGYVFFCCQPTTIHELTKIMSEGQFHCVLESMQDKVRASEHKDAGINAFTAEQAGRYLSSLIVEDDAKEDLAIAFMVSDNFN